MNQVLLSEKYPKILDTTVDYIVNNDLAPKAKELLDLLEKKTKEEMEDLRKQPKLLKFYQTEMTKLKFICLPLLDDKVVLSLFRRNFLFSYTLPNYDILEKLNQKLVFILLLDDRNKFKEELKKVLLENTEKVTVNHEIKTVQDWLKNYISKVGFDGDNNLAKAQFLTSLRNDKNIDPKEYQKLVGLFDVYDIANIPSDVPQGFEEEYPIKMDGKLYIFRRGALEEVPDDSKYYNKAKELLGENEEKNIDSSSNSDIINELEKALQKYSPGSLEYKALSEEIKRLKNK